MNGLNFRASISLASLKENIIEYNSPESIYLLTSREIWHGELFWEMCVRWFPGTFPSLPRWISAIHRAFNRGSVTRFYSASNKNCLVLREFFDRWDKSSWKLLFTADFYLKFPGPDVEYTSVSEKSRLPKGCTERFKFLGKVDTRPPLLLFQCWPISGEAYCNSNFFVLLQRMEYEWSGKSYLLIVQEDFWRCHFRAIWIKLFSRFVLMGFRPPLAVPDERFSAASSINCSLV